MEEETNLQLRLSCSKHPLCGMVCVWDLRNSKDHILAGGRSSFGGLLPTKTPPGRGVNVPAYFNTPLL